jgi:hypothetical protein
MSSRRALTGGTGDVNPQFISFRATQTVTDATAVLTIPVPIQRMPSGGRAQVLEVLCVKYEANTFGGSNGTETVHRYYTPTSNYASSTVDFQTVHSISVAVSTRNPGTTNVGLDNPAVFSYYNVVRFGAFTAGGSYAVLIREPFVDDLTDGAGHGFLVATDNIFIQIASQATNAPQACAGKIYYRWKNVGLQEYIGIVQSQQ